MTPRELVYDDWAARHFTARRAPTRLAAARRAHSDRYLIAAVAIGSVAIFLLGGAVAVPPGTAATSGSPFTATFAALGLISALVWLHRGRRQGGGR